jgi:hypothetical protein
MINFKNITIIFFAFPFIWQNNLKIVREQKINYFYFYFVARGQQQQHLPPPPLTTLC